MRTEQTHVARTSDMAQCIGLYDQTQRHSDKHKLNFF